MKKILLSGVLTLTMGFAYASNNSSLDNTKANNVSITQNTKSSIQIASSDDDNVICEAAGIAAEVAARKAGASKSAAQKVRFAVEMACESLFD